MPLPDIPAWCRYRRGRSAVLLIAPHGGEADTTTARAIDTKVNDVHTAELTWELAASLDASAIVNASLDRNMLDLNRISQVTRDAPWFPTLIEDVLASLLATHATVEVLFIHGWNVIQPKCDIGIGARFQSEAEASSLAQLTVDAGYPHNRLRSLRSNLTRAGVHLTFGERYPASHRNNLLQLFRRDGSRSCSTAPRICEWAASGRINAVQLELGVPLRWPGRWRDAFVQTLVDTIGETDSLVSPHAPGTTENAADPPRSTMLLAYDPDAAIGFMSSIGMQPDHHIGGRLLIFTESQTMALFTGEDPGARGHVVGGPQFTTRGQCTDLHFDGPILEVRDGAAYVRLEQAFRQSRLVDAQLHVTFEPGLNDNYGRIRGTLRRDGTTRALNALAFRDVSIFLRRGSQHAPRCAAAMAFDAERGVQAVTNDDNTVSWTFHHPHQTESASSAADVVEQHLPGVEFPQRIIITGGRSLVLEPMNRMQIRRPLASGGGEMIFLGLARGRMECGPSGYGFYEYVRPVT